MLTFIPQDPFWPERQILLFHWNPYLQEKRSLSPSPVTSPLIYWSTNEASPGSEMVCRQQLSLCAFTSGNSQLGLNAHRKKKGNHYNPGFLSCSQLCSSYRCYYLMFVCKGWYHWNVLEVMTFLFIRALVWKASSGSPVRKTSGFSVLFCLGLAVELSPQLQFGGTKIIQECLRDPWCHSVLFEASGNKYCHSQPGKSRWISFPFSAPQGSCCRTQRNRSWGARGVRPLWQCCVLTRRMRASTPSVSPRCMDTRSRAPMCLSEVPACLLS